MTKITEFKPQRKNANKHTQRGIGMLEKSIQTDGFIDAQTVAADGEMISGSARLELAADKFAEVDPIIVHSDGSRPVIVIRDDIPSADDPRARRLSVAANQIGAADWNPDGELLTEWAGEDEAIKRMFADSEWEEATGNAKGEPQDAEPQVDRAAELNEKWQVKTGDLFRVGDHRLLCGDSTKREDVERVMGGEKADLCLTDPPYATGGKSEDYDIAESQLVELIAKFLPIVLDFSDRVLLTPGNKFQFLYPKPEWVLAWFVQVGVGANPWGFTFWNAIFAYGKDPYLLRGLGSRPDAFVKTEASEKTDHSTSKPVGVWSWILERGSVDIGETVFDPFAGSGTTLVACQNLQRKCRAIEISPNYCAVILERMVTAFPGVEIERIEK